MWITCEFNVDKYLYLHQIDIRLFKKLTFSALEGMIVNAPFELRFINPLTVFHGYAPWKDYDSDFEEAYTGALFALKIPACIIFIVIYCFLLDCL